MFGDKHCDRRHTVDFDADGNNPVDSTGHRPRRVHVKKLETVGGGLLDFLEKSITKVHGSMLLALRGGGWV